MVTFREIIKTNPFSKPNAYRERRTVVGSFAPFRRDIYKWRFLDPHEEMRQDWEMYMYNAFVNAAINTLVRFISGNEIKIESDDQNTSEFLEKYLNKRGFELQMLDVISKTMICGNGYLEIDYDPTTGLPDKFYSIADPSRMYVNFDKYGNPKTDEEAYLQRVDPIYNEPDARWYELSYHIGYSYHKIRIKAIPIHFLKLIHFRLNLSINGVYGRANISSAINDNETLAEMERAIAIIAKFRAVPKKMISYGTPEQPASPEEMNNLSAYLDNLLPEENAIINKQFKMEDLSFAGRDIRFGEYLSHTRKKIIAGTAPEFLLGLGDEVNRATAHEQLVAFLMGIESDRKIFTSQIEELILKPIIKYYNARGGLQTKEGRKLLSDDVSIKFGTIDFETQAEKVTRLSGLWTSNAITLNELRTELGMEEQDGGEVYYADWIAMHGLQMKPAADMPNVRQPKQDQEPTEAEPIGYQPNLNPNTSAFTEELQSDPAGVSYMQFRYTTRFKSLFHSSLQPVLEQMQSADIGKENFSPQQMERAFDALPNLCLEEIGNLVNESYGQGWKEARKRMFLTNKEVAPGVISNLKTQTFSQITTLTKTKKAKFKKLIEEYITERRQMRASTPMGDFIKKVSEEFDIALYEAERIVRSEIVRLHSEGVRDAILANPDYPQRYEWRTSMEENTCPICKELHKRVFRASLPVTDNPAKINSRINSALPVVSTHPHCNCTIVPVSIKPGK